MESMKSVDLMGEMAYIYVQTILSYYYLSIMEMIICLWNVRQVKA